MMVLLLLIRSSIYNFYYFLINSIALISVLFIHALGFWLVCVYRKLWNWIHLVVLLFVLVVVFVVMMMVLVTITA